VELPQAKSSAGFGSCTTCPRADDSGKRPRQVVSEFSIFFES
jgi:hypothetical protein